MVSFEAHKFLIWWSHNTLSHTTLSWSPPQPSPPFYLSNGPWQYPKLYKQCYLKPQYSALRVKPFVLLAFSASCFYHIWSLNLLRPPICQPCFLPVCHTCLFRTFSSPTLSLSNLALRAQYYKLSTPRIFHPFISVFLLNSFCNLQPYINPTTCLLYFYSY